MYPYSQSMFVSCIALSFVVSIAQCSPTFLPQSYSYMRSGISQFKTENSDNVEAEGNGIYRDPSESGGPINKLLPLPNMKSPPTTRGIDNADHNCDSKANDEGYGFFRDPLEVLGPRFPRACMATMCENLVQMRSDNLVSEVRYTRRGAKMCSDICVQYRENMLKNNAGVDIQSMPGYCDNAGTADGTASGTQDLSSVCTCGYKVRCDRHSELLLYTFETNSDGNLRVSVSESDQKHYVTLLEQLSANLRELTKLR